jgi:hypothetical protein
MTLKEWAYANDLSSEYEQYMDQVAGLREYYEDHTDDLELAISQIQDSYPELFGGDEE